MHGIVTVRHRIDDRLEHRRHIVLRQVDTPQHLSCPHPLVAGDEPAGAGDLPVDRARDVGGIELVPRGLQRLGHTAPAVRHRLHVGMRQPLDRLRRPEQNPGDGRKRTAGARPGGRAELARQGLPIVAHAGDRETVDQRAIEIGERRIVQRLFVEADQPRLAALLMETHQKVGSILRFAAPTRCRNPLWLSCTNRLGETSTRRTGRGTPSESGSSSRSLKG